MAIFESLTYFKAFVTSEDGEENVTNAFHLFPLQKEEKVDPALASIQVSTATMTALPSLL